MCRPKHVEQLRNNGIINSTTRLHLVGSFYEMFGYFFVLRVTVLFCKNNISWGLNATLRKTEILISSKKMGVISLSC